MKGRVVLIGLALVAVLTLSFAGTALAKEKVITWKMAGVWGPGDAAYLPETFARDVTEKSGGRLKIITYPGGQLYGSRDIFGALQKGLIQVCEIPTGYWGGAIPLYKLPDTPFLLKDNSEWRAWLEGGLWELWQKEAEKVGIKVLGMSGWNGLQAFARYPIRTLADAKGHKWRVYNPTTAAAVQALGATPVTMGFPQTYQALQRGVMDAAYGGVTWAYAYKWHEVGKYITKVDFGLPPTGIFVNLKAFNALPPDLQKIVEKAGRDYMDLGWDIVEIFTNKKWKAFEEEGNDVYILPEEERTKWVNKAKHIWMEQAKKIGPVGEEALDIYFRIYPDRKP
jgi:TRAP-type C4-dicarboxylate transport system substrate-binding protein